MLVAVDVGQFKAKLQWLMESPYEIRQCET